MRTNRLYRVQAREAGKLHAARTDGNGTLAQRAVCGTRLRTASVAMEVRGGFGRDGDCGRCRRVLST